MDRTDGHFQFRGNFLSLAIVDDHFPTGFPGVGLEIGFHDLQCLLHQLGTVSVVVPPMVGLNGVGTPPSNKLPRYETVIRSAFHFLEMRIISLHFSYAAPLYWLP